MACLNRGIVALVAFVWFFSRVSFQMFLQSACMNGCKVALVAFVRFLARVSFQMSPQMACLNRCIVALLAFVWFFSRVSFQMSLQIAGLNRCKVALVAFVRFDSRMNFQMRPQIACLNRCILAFRGSVHHSNKLLTEYFCVVVVEFWRFLLSLFLLTMTRFEILPKSPSQSIKKQTGDSFVSCYKLSTALTAQGPSLSLWTQNILVYTFCQTTFSQPNSQFLPTPLLLPSCTLCSLEFRWQSLCTLKVSRSQNKIVNP